MSELAVNKLESSATSETAIIRVLEATHPVSVEEIATLSDSTIVQLRKLKIPGEPDLFAKLAGLFRATSLEAIATLADAFKCADLKKAATICHKLKSSTANIGALVFSREVRRLESLCLNAEGEAAQELFCELKIAHAMLLENLSKVVSQKDAA